MAKIVINSPKYGVKVVSVSDEDYEKLLNHKWWVAKRGNYFYAGFSIHKNESGKRAVVYMHRLVLGISDPGIIVDHKDRDGLNNKRENLRVCTKVQNACNRKSNGSSKYLGVCLHKKTAKWRATIKYNGKQNHLGFYEFEEDAALAYNEVAKIIHGDFANLNVIPEQNAFRV